MTRNCCNRIPNCWSRAGRRELSRWPLRSLPRNRSLPTVAIAGHKLVDGVTNIILDHRHAGRMALEHLAELGHREFALMKGPPTSADTDARWAGICEAVDALKNSVRTEFVVRGSEPALRRSRVMRRRKSCSENRVDLRPCSRSTIWPRSAPFGPSTTPDCESRTIFPWLDSTTYRMRRTPGRA